MKKTEIFVTESDDKIIMKEVNVSNLNHVEKFEYLRSIIRNEGSCKQRAI